MRASLYLVGFAVASLVGTGIVEIGCSSSSSPATTTPEASTDSGGDEDVDAGTTPCTPAPVNAATFDAGNATWSCLQTACATTLAACGADCPCNDAILAALLCQADGGSTTLCFTPAYEVDNAGSAVIACLQTKTAGCGLSLDGGGDGGTSGTDSGITTDASTDAGTTSDAASTDGAPEAAP
jgi:hypothetical protein